MKIVLFCFTIFLVKSISGQTTAATHLPGKIIIDGEVPPGFDKKTISLTVYPADKITLETEEVFTIEKSAQAQSVKWELPPQHKPVLVYGSFIKSPRNVMNYLLEPGDMVSIRYKEDGSPVFEGTGAEKFRLIHRLSVLFDSVKAAQSGMGLSRTHQSVSSLEDYLQWNDFLNTQLNITLPLIETYKKSLSAYAYASISEAVINEIETRRITKFNSLAKNYLSPAEQKILPVKNQFGLTNSDLCFIYDSSLNGHAAKWLQFETPVVSFAYYYYLRSSLDAQREKKIFFKEHAVDTSALGREKADAYVNQYHLVKNKYKGIIREAALAFFFHFPRGVLRSVGFDPRIEGILADYYANSEYPEFAKAVKEYELKLRGRKKGGAEPGFTLTDRNDKEVHKLQFEGKITVMEFWFTGCRGCIQLNPYMRALEKQFEHEPNVQFVNVSIDKNKETWIKSLDEKIFTTETGLPLYTGGLGSEHSLLRNYLISSYPSLLVFDAYGRSIPDRLVKDPRKDGGKGLSSLIHSQLKYLKDGPYIYQHKTQIETNYLYGSKFSTGYTSDSTLQFHVRIDKHDSLIVKIQPAPQVQPSVYPMPDKLLILSDIEGNYNSLNQLLIGNGVMNKDHEWIFGNGHLVFAGDMFDRGEQVTECLWLLYMLEYKAKQKGGYVHFILGNHEIMNLQGDHRYTQIKYKKNAARLNRTTRDLHSPNSILGAWLRSKNTIEKIGDLLIVHGGISEQVNQLDIGLEQINRIARPYFDSFNAVYKDPNVNIIMNDRSGLIWNRDYYTLDKEKIHVRLEETLKKFSVNHIITGHTIVSDEVSVHFEGMLFNTDTKHAEGKSEALYIEGTKFYRSNSTGDRILLYESKM